MKMCLICDYLLTREAYVRALSSLEGIEFVIDFDKFTDCIDYVMHKQTDVILVDVQLHEKEFETIKRMKELFRKTKIIVIAEQKDFLQVMALGAAYVLKNMLLKEFVNVIETIIRGNMFIASDAAEYVVSIFQEKLNKTVQFLDSELTERELDILARIAKGMSNSQIGNELALSQFTVKNYVSQIISKLQVTTRTEAAAKAIQCGLI